MSQQLPESERPWRLYAAIALVVILIGTGLFFAGGQHVPEESPQPGGQTDDGQRQRVCEEQLAGILAAVDPKQLGLSSRVSDRAYDLNLWREDCGSQFAGERIAEDEDLLRKLLPAEVADRALQPEYTQRDVAHLRTTILLRQAAEHVTAGEPDALRQAVRLFDFVQRNVLTSGSESPTMTPYEILLVGRGSAVQRAWLLAELLRQIEIDAVILRPAGAAPDANDDWLLGVLVSRDGDQSPQVYLFDMVAGLPVPAAGEQASRAILVSQPATLAEVRADDGLLRTLDVADAPYRFTADGLAQVRVELIGSSSLWANRVAAIDYAIELRGAIFYDGLGKNRLKERSLYDRVVAAGSGGGWTADDTAVWEFPERELAAFETPGAAGGEFLANYLAMLNGPIVRDIIDPETGLKLEWDHPLIEARHLHLTGAYTEAIQDYNLIRSGFGVFVTPHPVNDYCRESAVYWTTGCQFELGRFDSVINARTGGQYPPPMFAGVPPIWADGMARLVALSAAALGSLEDAALILQQLPVDVPQGQQYLIRRWTRLAQPAPAEGDKPQTPAESSPSAEQPDGEKPAPDAPATETPAKPAEPTPEPAASETKPPTADPQPAEQDASADSPPAAPPPAATDGA